jgi:hypothetical protein
MPKVKVLVGGEVTVPDLAEAIQDEYPEFNVPADQILVDPTLAEQFAARVSQRLGLKKVLDVAIVNKRLLTERKQGHLRRLERAFNGRNIRINKPR